MKENNSSLEVLAYVLLAIALILILLGIIATFNMILYQRCQNIEFNNFACERYRNF